MDFKLTRLVLDQNGKCHYCNKDFIYDPKSPLRPTKDHKEPKSKNKGKHNNTVAACYECNHKKGSMGYDDFLRKVRGWIAKN